MRRAAPLLLATAAFLALADTGIVALALPPILLELDTTVSGAAAVLGVYAVVLAAALLPGVALARRLGTRLTGIAALVLFGLGSLISGLAESLPLLLTARAVQAAGGGLLLVLAFAQSSTRVWRLVALVGILAGPALGGALTQAFGWRSIFLIQAALAPLLLLAFLRLEPWRPSPEGPPHRLAAAPAAALLLVSGALAAALFLTVLLLVNGWSLEPLGAAAAVSAVPVAALLGSAIGARPASRATLGALLLASGTACLAFLPDAAVAWTLLPQVVAGLGMGLVLPALAGELLPERDEREAARLLVLRHAGIAIALILLAPVLTAQLDDGVEEAKQEGAALILDAKLPPGDKLELAPELAGAVQSDDPRDDLRKEFDDFESEIDGEDRAAYDDLRQRADETLVTGVNEGFAVAFLVGAGLALLAGALLWRGLPARLAVIAATGAIAVPAAFAIAAEPSRPPDVVIADPCEERELPDTGGLGGLVQDAALVALDRAACDAGSSREELVLALVDDEEAERYEERYGLDPRSVLDLIGAAIGGG